MPKEYINPPSLFRSRDHGFSQGVAASGTRPEKAEAVGSALRESFSGPAKPATTWIGLVALADPGFLIEIEAIAVLD